VALYRLVNDLVNLHGVAKLTLITHSLGAHVGLRCASVLGERLYHGRSRIRFANCLLLAAAVEDDVFSRPTLLEEYHFPDAPFAVEDLHIFVSRADDVLKHAFRVGEWDAALGYSGPETMQPLKSLARRVAELSNGKDQFTFQLHDFSPSSPTVLNPAVWATGHGDYWERDAQVDYYVNYI
jgi:esterase/lipase superfamily enzyme